MSEKNQGFFGRLFGGDDEEEKKQEEKKQEEQTAQKNDLIQKVNGKPVKTIADLRAAQSTLAGKAMQVQAPTYRAWILSFPTNLRNLADFQRAATNTWLLWIFQNHRAQPQKRTVRCQVQVRTASKGLFWMWAESD